MTPYPKRRPHVPIPFAGFGDQLRQVIAARSLTAYSVARSAGISPSVVSRFLSRERGLTLETFDSICGALGLRLIEGGKGRGRPARPSQVRTLDAPELAEDEDMVELVPEPMEPAKRPVGDAVECPAEALGHMVMDDDGCPPLATPGHP
jgi:transcriptional regulator with XRE-family HTH domain